MPRLAASKKPENDKDPVINAALAGIDKLLASSAAADIPASLVFMVIVPIRVCRVKETESVRLFDIKQSACQENKLHYLQ
jgi:hypothetical protein